MQNVYGAASKKIYYDPTCDLGRHHLYIMMACPDAIGGGYAFLDW